MTEAHVEVVRVYEDPGRSPGEHRVLVDRLWPRGQSKGAVDHPRRYRAELAGEPGASAVSKLRKLAASRRLVLLTATRDVGHSGAAVLQAVVVGPGAR